MAVYTLQIEIEGIDHLSSVLQRAEGSVNSAAKGIGRSLDRVEKSLKDVGRTGEYQVRSDAALVTAMGSVHDDFVDAVTKQTVSPHSSIVIRGP